MIRGKKRALRAQRRQYEAYGALSAAVAEGDPCFSPGEGRKWPFLAKNFLKLPNTNK
jgi:hypothetical protein